MLKCSDQCERDNPVRILTGAGEAEISMGESLGAAFSAACGGSGKVLFFDCLTFSQEF